MCVEVDRDADLLLQRLHQLGRRRRFAQPSHVLDGEHVCSHLLEFLGEVHVVLQIVLRPIRVEDVARVADGRFADHPCLDNRVHRDLHVRCPVERIEHAEHVHSRRGRLLHELDHDVVGVVRVADRVRCPKQHLEQDVRDLLTQLSQSVPRALLVESHRRVERRPAPHLQREELWAEPSIRAGDIQQVMRAKPGGQQRLMSISHRGVGDEQPLLGKNPLSKFLRGLVVPELFSQCFEARLGSVGDRCVQIEIRQRSGSSIDLRGRCGVNLARIQDRVGEERKNLRRTVFPRRELEQLGRLVDEPRRETTGHEFWVGHDLNEERNVRLHAPHTELLQHSLHAGGRILEPTASHRDLDQQRIVERIDNRSRKRAAAVETDTCSTGRAIVRDATVVGHEIVRRVFRGHAALHREAVRFDVGLRPEIDLGVRQQRSLSHQNLRLHDVDAGYLFGDGVLDLDARIDFDEIELVVLGVEQELDGPRVLIGDRLADLDRRLADRIANLRVQKRSRRDLDHFLMASLDRAVSLEQMDQVSMLVAEQLHFDVTRLRNEFLDKNVGRSERGHRFALSRLKQSGEILGLEHHAHATSAATVGRLEYHRVAGFLRQLLPIGNIGNRFRAASQDGHTRRASQLARGDLVAKLFENLDRRPDEDDSRRIACRREQRVLGEESVTGMDRIDTRFFRDADNRGDVEVRLDRLAPLTDLIRLIRLEAVQGVAVFVRVDGNGADPKFVGRSKNSDGDFTAVGNEQLADGLHAAGVFSFEIGRLVVQVRSERIQEVLEDSQFTRGGVWTNGDF